MKPEKDLKEQQAFDGVDFKVEDEKLYDLLFSELKNEKDINIQPQFSAKVISQLASRKRKESRSESFLFGFAIVGVMLITVLAASFAKSALQSSPDLLQNSPLTPALLFAGLLALFQFIDKKYLRDHRLKRKLKSGQSGFEL